MKSIGVTGTFTIVIGALFKLQHYPYQNEILVLGTILFSIFGLWTLILINTSSQKLETKVKWTILIVLFPVISLWVFHILSSTFTIRNQP